MAARAHFSASVPRACLPVASIIAGRGEASHVRARLQVFKKMVGVRGNIRLIEFNIFARVKDHLDFALRRLCAHYRKHVLDAPLR